MPENDRAIRRPSDHTAYRAVVTHDGGTRSPIWRRNAWVTVPLATLGTPSLIRTTKTDRGRNTDQIPCRQCHQPELKEEIHWLFSRLD